MNDTIEKIEVAKHNGSFYYTGILKDLDDDWVEIRTTRGEILKFRKKQIMQRRAIQDTKETDTNENKQNLPI